MAPKNAFYAQSGGVTAVINTTACGVLETARRYPEQIGKVYAGRNGIIGALTEDPKSFGKALIFVVLGEGIALYGMLIAILIITKF